MKPELRKLIELKAAAYQLDPDLVEAHILTESSGKPDATRFENAFYEHYIFPLNLKDQNEARGRATSFGLLQIMGQVARELGYKGPWSGLMDPETNLEWGCLKLSKCYKKYAPNLDEGIAAYNCGTPRYKNGKLVNQVYVDRVHGFLKMIKNEAGK
jgi:soluble lytic murein transglycosylase-like protein